MSLKQLLSDIRKNQLKAGLKVTATSATTANARNGQKRSAQLRLPYLERDYKNAVAPHIALFLVAGSGAKDFGEISESITKSKTFDAEAMFKKVLSLMPEEAGNGKMSPKTIVDLMTRHLVDVAEESDIVDMPRPMYKHSKGFSVKNREDLYKLIKQVLIAAEGSALSGVYLLKQIAKNAMDDGFDEDLYPVIVTLEDAAILEGTILGLRQIFGQVHLIQAGESLKTSIKETASLKEVTKDSVLDTLKKVKQVITKGGRKTTRKTTTKEQTQGETSNENR